jgi:hypothetical protein
VPDEEPVPEPDVPDPDLVPNEEGVPEPDVHDQDAAGPGVSTFGRPGAPKVHNSPACLGMLCPGSGSGSGSGSG